MEIDDKNYMLTCNRENTVLQYREKVVVTLNYRADLNPKTAPEFAHKLLNLKAFS